MNNEKYDVIVNYLKVINTKLNKLLDKDDYNGKHAKKDEDKVMEMLNDMFEDLGHITIIRNKVK